MKNRFGFLRLFNISDVWALLQTLMFWRNVKTREGGFRGYVNKADVTLHAPRGPGHTTRLCNSTVLILAARHESASSSNCLATDGFFKRQFGMGRYFRGIQNNRLLEK